MEGTERPDYSVYLVADRSSCLDRDILDVVEGAVRGGAGMVQLRDKQAGARELVQLARQMKRLLHSMEVPLIINDRVDVALACGADGVHVGQEDMDPKDVRLLTGPDLLVGLSVHTPDLAREADKLPVSYLGAGPVFGTRSKDDPKPSLGVQGLANIREQTSLPLVGIGSVTADSAGEVIRAGADGIAVISAICEAQSPYEAARELSRAVRAARSGACRA
jgi:thiamine-phosphate pyrophosphorylase